MVHGHAIVNLIDDAAEIRRCNSPSDKPFLRVTIGGQEIDITTNLAEMIGGAGAGLRKRHEDAVRTAH